MKVTGEMPIGKATRFGAAGTVKAFDPRRGVEIEPPFGVATADDVDDACQLALRAFESYRETSPAERGAFLVRAADNLLALGDVLYERAASETGLTVERIKGETARTAAQLKLFADVVRHGRWRNATIDSGDPTREPLPKAELRMQKVPVGPVAVFGASNFPILYSVAGGDTASALAAGCPVVVKAHGSHPGTSELVGKAIQAAVAQSGLHEGVFSLLIGAGNAVGEALVDHPAIHAVGFTGSEAGGMALVRRGAARPVPIPVFAEMTSVNPNFVLPHALEVRAPEFASRFVERMTAGAGQMCLKPGMIVAIEGPGFGALRDALAHALRGVPAQTMLSPGIYENFRRETERSRHGQSSVSIAQGQAPEARFDGQSEIFEMDATELLAEPALAGEMFGPAAVLVRCRDTQQMLAVAAGLQGQLTVALHIDSGDIELARLLLPVVERKTNRILANKFSNMVEIGYATVHGGPFPATSDSRFTSVGATAIERFLRPVCYENLPAELLPPALRDDNPLSLWRVRDGELEQR
ncbi:aldehyde dehydrogenase (NADP(+)) [Paraburkholderia caballeronis]|uniref:NADP-dependent aldehyde dehydrogenase n=1 Tax=Paraburkholderia caballeronis TaxID=416943 RepID=A0A1H7L6H4_9BURK|nr:aldehyde dehydrogenase (NADP(+)) [Paraburkholderia caballeronis]PXW28306.1 NADP-dependent aldehyde dehydrogenase [Paraburkholderia caballeronis]PXX03672.1 NADP-dependent aldehyde dehydrogenase [Paraburkholderia caballeronis]RAK04416.1 NADP-dependent aldehyde dehydrogenase [Paraburkholderia caballeronis]SED81054.1 NADP-dependent aldehyde dehydrogenase [Paraburkholderia caballeronis]SEK94316.1 NADP-dependent aldehyde dehydrogenase [Paraburkholderia caballeronis]